MDGHAWTIASGGVWHWVYLCLGMFFVVIVVIAFALMRSCADRNEAYEEEDF